MAIHDYNADQDLVLEDPTDPNETVEKKLMDKLALALTRAEEALQRGSGKIDQTKFYDARGAALDMFDDAEVADFLDRMRKRNRCPFRKFQVS